MTIHQLVAHGRLQQAIQLLIEAQQEDAILLMGRLTTLNRDKMLGLIDGSTAQREMARLTQAVLHCAGAQPKQAAGYTPTTRIVIATDFKEGALLDVIRTNKRRRPEMAQEAQNILTAYRDYKDAKELKPSFDPANRRFRAIQASADALFKRLTQEQEISLEQIVEQIALLLEPIKPEYKALKTAYQLAAGRGFKNNWIEQQLIAMPDDDEVRITIAEEIEAFTANISCK